MSSAKPSFDTPAQVVSFIRQCIEANDAKTLYAACTQETSDFWKDYIFQDFAAIQQSETLANVFLKDGQVAVFPTSSSVFKLGGHDVRTRHLHIDLERIEGRWYLEKIWKCR
jgi:hypothetical protein